MLAEDWIATSLFGPSRGFRPKSAKGGSIPLITRFCIAASSGYSTPTADSADYSTPSFPEDQPSQQALFKACRFLNSPSSPTTPHTSSFGNIVKSPSLQRAAPSSASLESISSCSLRLPSGQKHCVKVSPSPAPHLPRPRPRVLGSSLFSPTHPSQHHHTPDTTVSSESHFAR
ncbi:hypothetical protein SCUP234_06653 [Seiridium cupressi]